MHYYGHLVLRQKAKPIVKITEKTKKLIGDMVKIMDESNGQGLAAPQIGHSVRLFVVRFYQQREDGEFELSKEPTVFINPKILSYSEETCTMDEGCLSLPAMGAPVARPVSVEVSYMNENGETVETEFEDLHARVFCHENDHLNGILYVDRVDKKIRKQLDLYLDKIKREHRTV